MSNPNISYAALYFFRYASENNVVVKHKGEKKKEIRGRSQTDVYEPSTLLAITILCTSEVPS